MQIELSVTSVADREGIWDALKEFVPGAEVSILSELREGIGPPPDWLVGTAMLFQISGGVYPTLQGFQALVRFLNGLRTKYPTAPRATLRVINGPTGSSFEVEGINQQTIKQLFEQWLKQ